MWCDDPLLNIGNVYGTINPSTLCIVIQVIASEFTISEATVWLDWGLGAGHACFGIAALFQVNITCIGVERDSQMFKTALNNLWAVANRSSKVAQMFFLCILNICTYSIFLGCYRVCGFKPGAQFRRREYRLWFSRQPQRCAPGIQENRQECPNEFDCVCYHMYEADPLGLPKSEDPKRP